MQTRLAGIWYGMFRRCCEKKHKQYKNYGRHGIKICDEWQSFKVFRIWSYENGYSNSLELDRENVYGNYEPSNCRWITHKEQCRNTRRTRYITIDEMTKSMAEWCEEYGIKTTTIRGRLKRGVLGIDLLIKPRAAKRACREVQE